MSATDELCRLLDERGVEWSTCFVDDAVHTMWNDAACWFTEFKDGTTVWGKAMEGSPAQAIEATLGREALWYSSLYDEADPDGAYAWRCSECRAFARDYGIEGLPTVMFCPSCGARMTGVQR